jgi:hypothetical protein
MYDKTSTAPTEIIDQEAGDSTLLRYCFGIGSTPGTNSSRVS